MVVSSDFMLRFVVVVIVLLGVLGPHGVVNGKCVDTADNCRDYNKNVCQKYKDWAKKSCPKTCNFCGPCPDGWRQYTGDRTCLAIIGLQSTSDRTNWASAKKQCERFDGGSLVIVRDEHKNAFIKKMTPKGTVLWIGAKNVATSGINLKFVDGSLPGSYHPLMNPEPKWQEKCVVMSRELWDGYWYYRNCQTSRPYMCQKHAQAV